jgi:UDP-N-acetylmuramoyl-tripeptide--D-alanyl-D-alanine ligase
MLELGPGEVDLHAAVGRQVAAARIDRLVAMGPRGRHIAAGAREAGVEHVVETEDPAIAARVVASWTDPDDWVLVKASRGMRLERVIDALKEVVG